MFRMFCNTAIASVERHRQTTIGVAFGRSMLPITSGILYSPDTGRSSPTRLVLRIHYTYTHNCARYMMYTYMYM